MFSALRKPCCSPENRQYPTGRLFLTQFLHHGLGLAWRHDPVLFALEENHWNREPLGMKDRRPFGVQILPLGIRPHQSVQIARFELMRAASQRREIAYSEVAAAPRK